MATKTMVYSLKFKCHFRKLHTYTLQLKRAYFNTRLSHQKPFRIKNTIQRHIVHFSRIEPKYVIHFGNLLAVCAMLQCDMLYLRSFMIGASACGIAFNLLQPIPLIAPAYWGLFFMFSHSVQIYYLLRDKLSVTMSKDLIQIYESVFFNAGFTPKQFLDLCKHTNYTLIAYKKGAHICSDALHTFCLLNGRAVVKADKLANICIVDTEFDNKNEAQWLGGFLHEDNETNYECLSDCKVIRFDSNKLEIFLNQNENLKGKANTIKANDIKRKLRNMKESNMFHSYMAMLNVYIQCIVDKEENKLSNEVRDYIQRFGAQNHVDPHCIDLCLQQYHGMRYQQLFE